MAKKKAGKKASKKVVQQPARQQGKTAMVDALKAEITNLKGKNKALAADLKRAKEEVRVMRICEFCDHQFDVACGRYGCPNCNGDGLDEAGKLLGFLAVHATNSRRAMQAFPIIPTFGQAGPEQSFNAHMYGDFDWKGYRVVQVGDRLTLVPYKR